MRRRQPLPHKFVMPVLRTQALPLLNRARVFYLRGGGMVPSVVTSGTRSGASVTKQAWRSQQKTERATAPLPFKFVIPVSRTQALPLLNRARVFYLRGGEMVPSVVTSGTRSGASVFSGCALRVPEAKRGRVPCDGAEEIYAAPPPEHAQEQGGTPPLLNQNQNQKS